MISKKFRAWGKFGSEKNNHMVYDWQNSEYIEYVGFDGGGFFTVMQFTGLKDESEKDVYEGDVVEYYEYNSNKEKEIAVIEFQDGYEGDGFKICGFVSLTYDYPNGWKIIGNIYETPGFIGENK